MLQAREATQNVGTSFVPAPGQEVYDTVSGYTYRGDGYKSISELSPIANVSGGSNNDNEVIIYGPEFAENDFANNLNLAATNFGADTPATAVLQTLVPAGWTTIDVQIVTITDAGADGDTIFSTVVTAIDLVSGATQAFDAVEVTLTLSDAALAIETSTAVNDLALFDELDRVDLITIAVTRVADDEDDDNTDAVGLIAVKVINAS